MEKRMVRCTSGVTCKHADFDINELQEEWRKRVTCGPCLFAEIDRKAIFGAAADSRRWLYDNVGFQRQGPDHASAHYGGLSPA